MIINNTKYLMKVQPNILSLIGNTPLIRLEKIVAGFDGSFLTKLESTPVGSNAQ